MLNKLILFSLSRARARVSSRVHAPRARFEISNTVQLFEIASIASVVTVAAL